MRTKWTYEMLRDEALKYSTRIVFQKSSSSAYRTAYNRGILDDICTHMHRLGNIYNRFIYTIEFENNSVYIGLTCDLERRKSEHIINSSNKYVRKLINDNIKYKFISNDVLYSADESIKVESFLVNDYNKKGYNVLNISKAGALGGGNKKWTADIIIEEALKYKTRIGFKKGNPSAYKAAREKNILNDVCSHMCFIQISWNAEMIKEEALKYDNRSSFEKGNIKAYWAARRMCILDDVCSHMIRKKTKKTL